MDADNAVTLKTTIVDLIERMRQAAYDEGYEDGKSVGPDVKTIRREGAQVPLSSLADVPQPAPKCPSWCTEQHETDGWDVVGLNTTKFCRYEVPIDTNADVCRVTIERYAGSNEGRVKVEQVDVRVEISGEFGPGGLDALADGLRHAREVAGL